MSTKAATLAARPAETSLTQIHLLLAVQSIVILLISINRLSSLTTGYVAANEFLRWVDLNNMLLLPLLSLISFYFLKKTLEYDHPAREGSWHRLLGLTFVVGVYLLGAGYGDHEVTNYLHIRFCPPEENSRLCQIIIFNDDEFSHWVFFAGFTLINAALMILQVLFPHRSPVVLSDRTWLVLNGVFIALGIFANLAFEVIGIDLYIVALLTVLALGLLWRRGPQPLLIYYSTAYTLGLVATVVYKVMM